MAMNFLSHPTKHHLVIDGVHGRMKAHERESQAHACPCAFVLVRVRVRVMSMPVCVCVRVHVHCANECAHVPTRPKLVSIACTL